MYLHCWIYYLQICHSSLNKLINIIRSHSSKNIEKQLTVSKSKLDSIYNYMLNDQLCCGKKKSPLSQWNRDTVSLRSQNSTEQSGSCNFMTAGCAMPYSFLCSCTGFQFSWSYFLFSFKKSTACYKWGEKKLKANHFLSLYRCSYYS